MDSNISIGSGYSTNSDPILAIREALAKTKQSLDTNTIDYVYMLATVEYDCEKLVKEISSLLPAETKIHGITSCGGVAINNGFIKGPAIALLAISSPKIRFGVGVSEIRNAEQVRSAGAVAVAAAIQAANGSGKPTAIIMSSFPGNEEDIITGIEDVVGEGVMIVGGTAADNTVEGKWKQFSRDHTYQKAVVITVIYSQLKIGISFQSGCLPTERKAKVTRAKDRVIYELDGRPAGVVYNEWLGGALEDKMKNGGSILLATAFTPIGRPILKMDNKQDIYLLSHPAEINPVDKALSVFSRINEGDTIYLMRGTKVALILRAGIVTQHAILNGHFTFNHVAGALLTYCAGCMLAVGDDMSKATTEVNKNLMDKPFIGGFTYGEQGCFVDKKSRHGNLMISMLVFSDEEIK
ncbi:MAG: FIST N-terminal domain-containing protein [bacterium]|nr:FIST N-terminal domain-containing protein [bacterium]